jgi:hypothetical protein
VLLTRDGKPDIEEVGEIPLIPITPIPMPHKLTGMSIADLVMDLQLIKSTLMRQVLDGGYLALAPRTIVGQAAVNENTYDDLLTVRPGGVIRANDPAAIVPMPTNFRVDQTFPVLEYIDQTTEVRTGISRHNQGLNPDDLNKTATGVSLIQQQAAQRVELIARIFGETGVKVLVQRILGLVTRHQQHERIIRLTGRFVPMDPRQWRNSMDVSVSVGLGTGNRDQLLQHIGTILQSQMEIVKFQGGLNGPLVTAQNAYDALKTLSENAGFKQPLFTDPSKPPPPGAQPPQQPPPDPKMMQAQHGMQLDAEKAKIDSQLAQAKAQQDAAMQQQRLQNDMAIQQAQLAADQKMAQERFAFEREMEQLKFQHDMRLEQYREDRKAEIARHEIDTRARAGAYTPGPA